MQQTRQFILETLRAQGEGTVDEIVQALRGRINHDITAVTIRHHLDILRSEDLVTAPSVRRRRTPGRPQYVFGLTDKGRECFPNNYQNLSAALLSQIKAALPPAQVNVILENVAQELADDAAIPDLPLDARLDQVVDYLNKQGYEAAWEVCEQGYLLETRNCPYRHVAGDHQELCNMDIRLISALTGIVPRRVGRLADQDESCAYLIPLPVPVRAEPATA
jgi:DeoR family suf operon transcriptional repressor